MTNTLSQITCFLLEQKDLRSIFVILADDIIWHADLKLKDKVPSVGDLHLGSDRKPWPVLKVTSVGGSTSQQVCSSEPLDTAKPFTNAFSPPSKEEEESPVNWASWRAPRTEGMNLTSNKWLQKVTWNIHFFSSFCQKLSNALGNGFILNVRPVIAA